MSIVTFIHQIIDSVYRGLNPYLQSSFASSLFYNFNAICTALFDYLDLLLHNTASTSVMLLMLSIVYFILRLLYRERKIIYYCIYWLSTLPYHVALWFINLSFSTSRTFRLSRGLFGLLHQNNLANPVGPEILYSQVDEQDLITNIRTLEILIQRQKANNRVVPVVLPFFQNIINQNVLAVQALRQQLNVLRTTNPDVKIDVRPVVNQLSRHNFYQAQFNTCHSTTDFYYNAVLSRLRMDRQLHGAISCVARVLLRTIIYVVQVISVIPFFTIRANNFIQLIDNTIKPLMKTRISPDFLHRLNNRILNSMVQQNVFVHKPTIDSAFVALTPYLTSVYNRLHVNAERPLFPGERSYYFGHYVYPKILDQLNSKLEYQVNPDNILCTCQEIVNMYCDSRHISRPFMNIINGLDKFDFNNSKEWLYKNNLKCTFMDYAKNETLLHELDFQLPTGGFNSITSN